MGETALLENKNSPRKRREWSTKRSRLFEVVNFVFSCKVVLVDHFKIYNVKLFIKLYFFTKKILYLSANEEQGFEVVKLQKFLTEKISEFLDSKINYQIRRLKGKEKEDLYVGPDFYEEKDLINCKLL